MIIKCSLCGGPLKFDSDIQMMVCEHCSGMFPIEETKEEQLLNENSTPDGSTEASINGSIAGNANDHSVQDSVYDELIDCNIYTCKSCGAELMLNDVETATYCAYCGQPTIVFERIQKRKRPKYIIPFSISQTEAVVNIREKFIKGKYVPKELKFFDIDMVRGIYIPFALYDVMYKDKQLITGTISDSNGKNERIQDFLREATCDFRQIPIDASRQLSNESSERLEPFYYRDLLDFKVEYLSGYYADLRDEDFTILGSHAIQRSKEMFDEQMINTVTAKKKHITESNPHYNIENVDYALFPVWFLVFHQGSKQYTIMVNGQTGKVVGGIPLNKQKIVLDFFIMAISFSIISFLLISFASLTEIFREYLVYGLVIGITSVFGAAIKNIISYQKSVKLSLDESIRNYVTERQDH